MPRMRLFHGLREGAAQRAGGWQARWAEEKAAGHPGGM